MRHFLDIADYSTDQLRQILADAFVMKAKPHPMADRLSGKNIALLFEKPSTRTRISFEVGVNQLGAAPIVLDNKSMQLGRGEAVADTAQVMSRYVDAIMIRAESHDTVMELAHHASIPVINGLTNRSHPCQVMADVMTVAEKKAPDLDFSRLNIVWLGDGNNVAHSWIEAAARFGFTLTLSTPDALRPDADIIERAKAQGGTIHLSGDPAHAIKHADVVVTDTWISMSGADHIDAQAHKDMLEPYRVTAALMAQAAPDAIFMHCLPVYRGNEADADVVDGAQSVIWDEAENRLHVQKAIMCFCLAQARS
ncbi:MAG: ornithine carbamoyltransferase [Candidatus Puniceispirillales bacterium]